MKNIDFKRSMGEIKDSLKNFNIGFRVIIYQLSYISLSKYFVGTQILFWGPRIVAPI